MPAVLIWISVMISIHALHEESDKTAIGGFMHIQLFQSTLSMRRATILLLFYRDKLFKFQSTLSMRRATNSENEFTSLLRFQSTLSMRRATPSCDSLRAAHILFQSTLSMRRATRSQALQNAFTRISIHALHEESDPHLPDGLHGCGYFNPRSP